MRNPMFSAKVVVTLVIGVLVGYAVGVSGAHDAAKGRTVTMKQYIADFEAHKAKLTSSEIPMPLALVTGVLMTLAFFGAYELLALGLAKAFAAVGRRFSADHPPPPS